MNKTIEVNGVVLLSLAQACVNLELFIDDRSRALLNGVQPSDWYPITEFQRLLDFITSHYLSTEVILEQIGIEMMRIWYHSGPGHAIVQTGVDFLRHQTSSAGYYSLVRGDKDAIGEFTLLTLEEDRGLACVRSTTPFENAMERGILSGGLALCGDLRGIQVKTDLKDPSLLKIRFRKKTSKRLSVSDLQHELEQRQAFWRATNQSLAQTLTALREKEQSLAEANRQLRAARAESELLKKAVINVAPDAVISIDERSHIIEFNSSAERLFGLRREVALGQDLAQLIMPESQRKAHHRGLERYLAGSLPKRLNRAVEVEARRTDGSTFPARLIVSEVKLPERRVFTAYLQDLTAQKKAAAEIAQQREALAQREKLSALGSLLAGVAHELNNPLAILVGRAALLEMDTQDAKFLDSVAEIRQAADRCAKIVKTFLTMARQQAPEQVPTQLNELIHDTLSLVDYSLRTASIQVKLDLQSDLPELFADPVQLGQVFANLFVNAQHALLQVSTQRQISITTRYNALNRALIAWVSDNGPGVPADIQSRIFDPFYTTKPVGQGTGIGLTMSHSIVSSHHGRLRYETSSQGGAQFVMTLPLSPTESKDAAQQHDTETVSLQALHVLVIDDEPALAEMMGKILQRAGHRVSMANSGRQGFSILATEGVNAILCDIHMPDLNGPDFYAKLEQDYPTLAQNIAFLTGDTLGPLAHTFLRQTQRPVLEKPFNPDDLLSLLRRITVSSTDP